MNRPWQSHGHVTDGESHSRPSAGQPCGKWEGDSRSCATPGHAARVAATQRRRTQTQDQSAASTGPRRRLGVAVAWPIAWGSADLCLLSPSPLPLSATPDAITSRFSPTTRFPQAPAAPHEVIFAGKPAYIGEGDLNARLPVNFGDLMFGGGTGADTRRGAYYFPGNNLTTCPWEGECELTWTYSRR